MVGVLSVAVLGIAGLLMNVVIARYYGAAVLGVFNQVFAIYILAAQFAAFGIQLSVLRYAAEHREDADTLAALVRSGLLLVALVALIIVAIVLALRGAVAAAFSPRVADGLLYALPGLWAFALNKFLLNTLNGVRQMKTYSVFLSYRYLLLLIGVAIAASMRFEGSALPAVFSFAEVGLLLSMVFYMRRLLIGTISWQSAREWGRTHLRFGVRSVTGGAVSELNTRVDVLVLGLFTDDRTVGVFSFAAILTEGLLQIPLVIKRQADPVLTPLVLGGQHARLIASFRAWRRWTYVVMVLVCITAIILFPWFTRLATSDRELEAGWSLFALLLAAGTVQAGYIPISGVLNQGGFPWQQTMYLLWIFGTNIVLNLLLVPMLGAWGAAISTSVVFVASVFYLKHLVRKFMHLRI